jgi:rod shape-determining protein MreD
MSDRTPGIRPRQSLWRRLDMASRRSFPTATTALLLLLTAAPLGLAGQPEVQASVALAAVYFWSLFRPASMPPPVVFMLGLLTDLLDFAPVGVGVLSLLIVHGLALRWRRVLVRQGFVIVWLSFVAIASGAAALQWLLTSLLTFRLLPPGPGVFQAALSAGLYPMIATVLTRAHQTLAEPERA